LTLGLVATGCGGSDVSAGAESDAVNLNRCYGADCGVRAQSLGGEAIAAQPCGDVEGPLADPVLFEGIQPGVTALAAVAGDEGSVWALLSEGGGRYGYATINLVHYAADGTRLASQPVGEQSEHSVLRAAVAVDEADRVTLGLYSSYAPNADSEVTEVLELSSFDGDLNLLDTPLRFRGVAEPLLQGGPGGSIWLAGRAQANAFHGVVSRISEREPDWIQTAVPASGNAIGVSGFAVADDGTSAVLAGLTPKWSGTGPNILQLGIATFDASGQPVWTLKLPTEFTPGFVPALGGTAQGDLVVVGAVGEHGSQIRVQQFSRQGEPGWAYQMESSSVGVEVQRKSGRAVVSAGNGVAVIDAAGESCRRFSVAVDEESMAAAEPWRPDGEYFLAVGSGLARFRVPE
jgi:hypothetical protein